MGYRSDVTVMFPKETWDNLTDEEHEIIDAMKPDYEEDTQRGCHVIQFISRKWYSIYEVCAAFDAMLNELENKGMQYCKAIIGEDLTDSEEYFTDDWDYSLPTLSIVRDVVWTE